MNVNAVAKAFGNAASNVQDLATDYLSEKNTFDTTASSAQKH